MAELRAAPSPSQSRTQEGCTCTYMLTFFFFLFFYSFFFTGIPLPNLLLTLKCFFWKRKSEMGRKESCPSLKDKSEDALNGQSCALKIIMIIMVSNDLISVLFAVFLQHISPATEVVFLIMSSPDVLRRYLKYSVVVTSPGRLVFPSSHCTVWSCLFTQDSTLTALRSTEGETWRPTAAHFIPSTTHSGLVPSPASPLALALHFYAQVSICKIRSFKHECPINASAALWYRVWVSFFL